MKNPPYPVRMVDFFHRTGERRACARGRRDPAHSSDSGPTHFRQRVRKTHGFLIRDNGGISGQTGHKRLGAAPSTSIGLCPCAAAPQPAVHSPHRSLRWTADANGAQFFDAAAGTSRGSPARHRSPAPARLGRDQNPHEWASDHRPWRWSGGFQADGPWNTGEEKTACKS